MVNLADTILEQSRFEETPPVVIIPPASTGLFGVATTLYPTTSRNQFKTTISITVPTGAHGNQLIKFWFNIVLKIDAAKPACEFPASGNAIAYGEEHWFEQIRRPERFTLLATPCNLI